MSFLADPEFWKYASIPVVAGIVGWLTNWVAVRMTFYPLEPIGRPPFLGWQGIIPMKARKMAGIFVDSSLSRLGRLQEVFDGMEPALIARHVVDTMEPRMDELTDEIMLAHNPVLWPALAGHGVRLTLSGHTHHGQLSVPRLDWSLASVFLEHAMGSHRTGDSLLYINPGTNYWGLPFRLGALPEVTVLTLRRGEGPVLRPAGEPRKDDAAPAQSADAAPFPRSPCQEGTRPKDSIREPGPRDAGDEASGAAVEAAGAGVGPSRSHVDGARPPRVAAVDIGSNAIRFSAAEFPDGSRRVQLDYRRVPVRLGHSAFATGRLTAENMDVAVEALASFRRLLDTLEIRDVRVVATSAVTTAAIRTASVSLLLLRSAIELRTMLQWWYSPGRGTDSARAGPGVLMLRGLARGSPTNKACRRCRRRVWTPLALSESFPTPGQQSQDANGDGPPDQVKPTLKCLGSRDLTSPIGLPARFGMVCGQPPQGPPKAWSVFASTASQSDSRSLPSVSAMARIVKGTRYDALGRPR